MRKTKYSPTLFILSALFVMYFIVLFKITLFRGSYPEVRSVNLIPYNTIAECFELILSGRGFLQIASYFRGSRFIGISNILGNIIMFIPLGFMSALLFPKMRRLIKVLVFAFAFGVAIEVFQYIFACGASDIDDVILNTLGAAVGYCLYLLASRYLKCKKYEILISALMIAFTCTGFGVVNNNGYRSDYIVPSSPPAHAEALNSFNEPLTRKNIRPDNLANSIDTSGNPAAAVQDDSDDTECQLILVNKWNPMPDDYEVELIELANGQSVDKRIYPALQDMFDAAINDGVYPIVVSGYRTAEEQQRLLDNKIADYKSESNSDEDAITKAEAWVAILGTSEHQLGIAVDINADGINSAGYEVYEWLDRNSYKFGFICRYPADKTKITGVINEPWHYRYVGATAATEIYNQGVCLEEYLSNTN